MKDPNHDNFAVRLDRIDYIHSHGGGFEAAGTLGKSFFSTRRRSHWKARFVAMLILFAVTLLFMKAGMNVALGAVAYEEKIEALSNGDQVDRAGAWLLQVDPISEMMARKMRSWLY
ncbi:MAG: hypothetical protein WBA91_00380 [Paracoccaceae bacterium]